MTTPTTAEDVIREIAASGARRVKVAITDLDGVMRGKYIQIEKLRSALEGGFGFCNVVFGWDVDDVVYDNTAYTGWHTGYPDAECHLDPRTLRRIPWEDGIPFLLGDFQAAGGGPLAVCPRQLLKRVIGHADRLGYRAMFGPEFEWWNFREDPDSMAEKGYRDPRPITPGMHGYSMLRSGQNSAFFRDLMEQLADFGVPIEGLHTESGPGTYEAAVQVTDALEAADRAVLFKQGAKQIALRHGFMACFMAKWNIKLPGSGGHLHQSLWRDGKNVFFDGNDPLKMSETFRHYLAGQLKLLPAMTALFAPTINSYKRLVEGAWAPTRLTWAADNRTVTLRVISGGSKSTRLETRVPGADVNPYLGIAAALAAGLHGIENKVPLETPPVVGNGYEADAPSLPRNLSEAADALDGSKIARELFGDAFVDHYVATRRWECRQYAAAITDWEMRRYFEII
ncbi:MAG: glutamine synthetase [Myxococcales bacterium]|nr:glutamine synthetase [Myxococcales bacterium]